MLHGHCLRAGQKFPCQSSDFQGLWISEMRKKDVFFSYYYGIRVTEGTLGEVFTEAVTVANDSIAIFEYNPEYYLYPIYPQLQMHTSE